MADTINLTIDARRAQQIVVQDHEEATITLIAGDDVFYGDLGVSPEKAAGQLAADESKTFDQPVWIVSAGLSSVSLMTSSLRGTGMIGAFEAVSGAGGMIGRVSYHDAQGALIGHIAIIE